ncbi:response regulator transcription factor [Paenibacillus sp. Soil522]|uniref:response regulator transcription factor n=1 Tax=Paenibacillus sp. Soil522 TaxID=1736388 RepID=UPI0006FB633C|nr:response regulator [Paenibacillus sp. Soil522]KRE35255.1 hypothetical protein ASG81_22035 [Paenibacillus sp. Soil522]
MYTLFVADDESLVLNSITQLIDWKECGIEVAGSARDGETALAEILRLKPNIILTDIRMPGIGGLELIQAVRKAGLTAVCIIMSGYTEFEYAKKAIELQANDYLIKPVELDEIKDTVLKASVKYMEYEMQKKKEVQFLQYENAVREKLIYQHILGMHTGSNENGDVNLSGEYLVVVGKMDNKLPGDESDVLQLMDNMRKFTAEYDDGTFLFIREGEIILCQLCTQISQADHFVQLVSHLAIEHGKIRFGIAPGLSTVQTLHGYYIKAEQACEQAIFLNLPVCMYERRIEVSDYPLAEKPWIGQTGPMISYFHDNKCDKPFVLRQVYRWIQLMVQNMDQEYHIGLSGFFGTVNDMQEIIRSLSTLESITSQLQVWTELCSQLIRTREASYKEKLIADVKHYIHEQYHDPKLTLDVLAEHFKISVSHLSQLFSKKENVSVYEYMIKKRIEKSKELLTFSHIKISDIATMMGYDNPRYFSQVFRKRTGLTPGQYRSKHFIRSY